MAIFDLSKKRVWVAGHRGMVGSAIVRRLAQEDIQLQTVDRSALDLRHHPDVEAWVRAHRPQVVVLAAAKVGGILANANYPVDFLEDNLAIELSVIGAAARCGVEKLIFLGSTCIYPKFADQPIREEALLTGALEPTNEWYAIAKIAGRFEPGSAAFLAGAPISRTLAQWGPGMSMAAILGLAAMRGSRLRSHKLGLPLRPLAPVGGPLLRPRNTPRLG